MVPACQDVAALVAARSINELRRRYGTSLIGADHAPVGAALDGHRICVRGIPIETKATIGHVPGIKPIGARWGSQAGAGCLSPEHSVEGRLADGSPVSKGS